MDNSCWTEIGVKKQITLKSKSDGPMIFVITEIVIAEFTNNREQGTWNMEQNITRLTVPTIQTR